MAYPIPFSAQQIAQILDTQCVNRKSTASERTPLSLTLDSREANQNVLFIALIGEKIDAHQFIVDVSAKKSVVVCHPSWLEQNPQVSGIFIPVKDTTEALQKIATAHATSQKATRIAITGSNGKTTTKDMLTEVMSAFGSTISTLANHNNHIGLPQTLLRIAPENEFAILEMGTNHPGEIRTLTHIGQPQIAMITCVGQSHLEFFIDEDNVLIEKVCIAESLDQNGILLINADDDRLWKWSLENTHAPYRIIGVGTQRGQIRAENISFDAESKATFVVNNDTFSLNVPGLHQITNALLVIATAQVLGVETSTIQNALAHSKGSSMRMEKRTLLGRHLILDCYNANPSSTLAAINSFSQMKTENGVKIAVIGDMLELGIHAEKYHLDIAHALLDTTFSKILLVGPLCKFIFDFLNQNAPQKACEWFENSELLQAQITQKTQNGDTLLLKGSRGTALEKILLGLSETQSSLGDKTL